MSEAEREQAIQAIIDRAQAVRQVLRVEIDPMRVYFQQDARGIKKVFEIAADGQLIKYERPEVEA